MDQIMSLLEGFDLAALLPDLQAIFSDIRTWIGMAMMAGPVVLFVIGLVYLLLPPKEANHRMGFRTFFGMGSVSAWKFTQRIAGAVWGALGLILGIWMYLWTKDIADLEIVDYVTQALTALFYQVWAVGISWAVLHIVPTIFFNHKGIRRWEPKPRQEPKG